MDLYDLEKSSKALDLNVPNREGEGLGPYWPQLSAYSAIVAQIFPAQPLRGVAIFWVDHGRLELVSQAMTQEV